MDQRDFNRSMSGYLKGRKDRGGPLDGIRDLFSSREKKGVTAEDEAPSEVPVEQVEAVLRGETIEPEDEYFGEEEPREPLWKRWFSGWVTFEDDEDGGHVEEEVVFVEDHPPKVDGDVKEMLRTMVGWLNQLPAEKLQEIKRSDEYVELKRLLNKYGLIK